VTKNVEMMLIEGFAAGQQLAFENCCKYANQNKAAYDQWDSIHRYLRDEQVKMFKAHCKEAK